MTDAGPGPSEPRIAHEPRARGATGAKK